MATNYTLKYRTFDELLNECMLDFRKYQDNGLIEPQELIKIARKCNYELGLRIYRTKEIVLDVTRGKVKLPNDFYIMNFALALGKGRYVTYMPQGTHVEEVRQKDLKVEYQCMPKDPTPCRETVKVCGCHLDCKGDLVTLMQTFNKQTYEWTEFFPLNIITDTEDFNGFCPGKYWQAAGTATIKNGWLYTSFETGKVYINYQGDMEDDEGNLLVPDHEILNEYYEYALKQRIMENVLMNDEEQNPNLLSNKLQLIEQRYRAARNNAMSLVNTPNFNELKEFVKMSRNSWYNRFYEMFSSHPNFKRI